MEDALCWIDIETTGLDPVRDEILEIGVKITDFQFNELETFHFWVADPFHITCVNKMDDFVRVMHRESGLLDDADLVTADEFYWAKGYTQLDIDFSGHLEFAKRKHDLDNLYPSGSSVHFDMAFLRAIGLAQTLGMLHHRHLDASTLKLYTLVLTGSYPETIKKLPEHRAMNDIESSIMAIKQLAESSQLTSLQADHTLKVVEARLDD